MTAQERLISNLVVAIVVGVSFNAVLTASGYHPVIEAIETISQTNK
nr:hypothetical protein [uncultured Mediterranean phage uvMED]